MFLQAKGYLEKSEPTKQALPICSRTGDLIEAVEKEHWFLDTENLRRAVLRVIPHEDAIRIFPDYHLNIWQSWLANLQPWCLSRQIVWGHQVGGFS